MKTIDEFIQSYGITLEAKEIPERTDVDWKDGTHWEVTLKSPRGELKTSYSMGSAHNGKTPELREVLDSLGMDISGISETPFETWCQEFGYNTDSIKALKTYNACKLISRQMYHLVGRQGRNELLNNVERL